MTNRLYKLYRWISGARYRLERRLTRPGWFAVLAIFAVASVGADLERTVAYRTFAVLFGFLLVSLVSVPFFPGSFTVERHLPRCGTAGQPLNYQVAVRNRCRKLQRGLTLLETLADQRMTLTEFRHSMRVTPRTRTLRLKQAGWARWRVHITEGELPALLAGEEGEATIQLTPRKRGVLRFTGVAIARTDALGLMRSFIRVPAPQTLLILPRRYPLPGLALPGTPRYQPGGVSLASKVGSSDEFALLRDYRHGDPLRHIHWRSWARVGHPITKEFQDEEFIRHALILDTFTEQDNEDIFEEVVSVAASFACAIRTQESLLDLMLVGPRAYRFTAGRGLAHTEQMLEILAAVEVTPDTPFDVLRNLVLQHASSLSGAVCVFTAWDEPRQELIRRMQALRLPVLVLVVIGAAEKIDLDPGPMRGDRNNFRVLPVGKVGEELKKLATAGANGVAK